MSRTTRRAGLGGLVAALVLFCLAVPAWAYFTVSSSAATATGRAATLGTPTVVTSGVTSSTVTFTVTAPPSGPTPTSYRVARTAPTEVSTVCTVSGASGSCTDTAPESGQTNAYAIYAKVGTSWESPTPGTTSLFVPSADNSAPVTTASPSPAPNGAGWNRTDVTVTLTATDPSGVAGTWYTTDGTNPTTLSSPYTAPFVVTSTAALKFFSRDSLGNTETTKSISLQIDKVDPTSAVTSPAASSINGGTVTVSGTASDGGSGLSSLQVQYLAPGSNTWATIGSPAVSNGSWSTSWGTTALTDGSYGLRVVATDVAGNARTSEPATIALKNTFTVTAPASATAGTPFNVTLQTYPGYTGTKAISVTGLQSSPSGAAPTMPSSASFTNGSATISVTPVKSGSQTLTVTDSSVSSLTGSASVNVNAGAAANLAWTTFVAQGVTQPTSTCYFTCTAVIGNNANGTSNISVTDAQGNILSNVGTARTVSVSAPSPSGGVPAGAQTLTIPASGPATSGTPQWAFKDNGNWTQYSFTATSPGLAQATLTVKKQ